MRARLLVVGGTLALLACIVLLLRTGDEDAPPSRDLRAARDAAGGYEPLAGDAPPADASQDAQLPGFTPAAPSPIQARTGSIVVERVADGLIVREPGIRVRLADTADDRPYDQVPGQRRFDALAPGTYAIDLAGSAWIAEPALVNLAAGAEARVALRPATVFAGLVLAGRRARPLDRAWLRLEACAPPAGDRRFAVSAALFKGDVTLDHGAFRLVGFDIPRSDVAFRHLRLLASAPGWFEAAAPDVPLLDTLHFTGIVVVLPAPVLTGRVLAPDEVAGSIPAVGAVVQVVPPETIPVQVSVVDGLPLVVDALRRTVPPLAQVTTDAHGVFLVPPLADGPDVRAVRLLTSAAGCRPLLTEPFELDQLAEPADRELLLLAGTRLHGTLRVRLVQPRLASAAEDADPPPAVATPRNVMLRLLDAPDPHAGAGHAVTPRRVPSPASDPDVAHWEFDAPGLEPGRWLVTAHFDLPVEEDLPALAPQSLVQSVTLVGGRRTDVTFTFPVEQGATVHGAVRLPEGLDVTLAEVGVAPSGPWQQPLAGAPLRADGRFEIGGVPPGAHDLFAFARTRDNGALGVTSQPLLVDERPVPARDLDLSRPEVRITVAETLRARRLVLGGETGAASFDTWLAMGRAWVVAGADGSAHFFGLLPGSYRLTAEGDPPLTVPFELPADRDVVHVDVAR